ncbi:c-type cytochrome [Chryseosolibacter indicus]|uniref:C-type cytochrome n=1 Tax=Chryseosolibacter indicus TaxID=2782351 RepID=A0ABS5VR72_9BACT|nr:cytochrome c [Chryseosolibacter indicus]MBT1703923.1 c-type cytochrome [Chryseosolibacter indicus]
MHLINEKTIRKGSNTLIVFLKIISVSYLLSLVFLFNQCTTKDTQGLSSYDSAGWPKSFGYGRLAQTPEIDSLNRDIDMDGRGLPQGSGDVLRGREIYVAKCALCHGMNGTEGPYNKLVAHFNESDSLSTKEKAIGNYWPYATTLYDYINRAMPYNSPGTLSPDEVYSLTAFLLYKNNIIDSTVVIDKSNLAKVEMPARKLFVDDDRRGGPEVR